MSLFVRVFGCTSGLRAGMSIPGWTEKDLDCSLRVPPRERPDIVGTHMSPPGHARKPHDCI
eukprot:9426411-Pyramimonas_sp.AAC.1